MKKNILKISLLGIVTGLLNGLFGSGGGTLLVPGMIFLLKTEVHKAHATAISIILPLTFISTIIYFKSGIINYEITLKVASGGIIGSYIGAKLLNKIPTNWLRKIFALFMMIAAFRMVF
ncbi:sulfite exporter TauE/SafE family protein [Caminicella sporogenes]|uniref:sulfite exporter TauE/SafE family protein n=1 Tax=Caminicella sporogenes TaxID=166485 RepID=UPI00253F9509|nr:sulfite exporter TauE/SafE family protein [Caminicella sporogenes]WIF94347.1 sulfite exporter TauE/SafE family protein [Caminicella sporogenes]